MITLSRLVLQTVREEGLEARSSELHGLSQREGSVKVEVRFGKQVFSPLIPKNTLDLAISLEAQESLSSLEFAYSGSQYLINDEFIPILDGGLKKQEIEKQIKKITDFFQFVPAGKICQESAGTSKVAGTYLLSLAITTGTIPLKMNSLKKAIDKIFLGKYREANKKAVELVNIEF